ncbi:MAG: ice-binding family protein [Polaromonas sp.]
MKQLTSYSSFRPWLTVLLLSAFAVGCGGGRDAILGADVATALLVVPPGAITPGAITPSAGCAVAGPAVTVTDPTNGNQFVTTSTSGVANSGKLITATFSEAMNSATINEATFKLAPTGGVVLVPASVTYNAATKVATFTTSSALLPNTAYTAVIESAATNSTSTPLGCSYAWNFKTVVAPATGLQSVNLDCAANFAILAGSTVTNTGPTIIKDGDLGLSPGSSVTGFPPGKIEGGVIRINDTQANNAKLCLTTAYNDAAGRTTAPITLSGNIGGQTLAPGLYKSTSTLEISSGDLTLAGPADGVWIFQIASTLTTTAARQIILSGGAQAKNIFWQVGTSATLGTTSDFKGNILADQSITLNTGAVLNGRALTRIAAVSLDSNSVTKPAP